MKTQVSQHLHDSILRASRELFSSAIRQLDLEHICAFGLYSDESAMTVLPAINTTAHLKKAIANDPDDPEYYRWSTAEWKYEAVSVDGGADGFQPICTYLRDELRNIPESELGNFCSDVYEICIQVLAQLRDEGLFGDRTVVFCISDDLDDERDIAWIKRLNSSAAAKEFARWVREEN